MSHRTCDLGQVMFWTWIVGGEASAAQGTPAQIVTEVLRRTGGGALIAHRHTLGKTVLC